MHKRLAIEKARNLNKEDMFSNAFALIESNYFETMILWQENSLQGARYNRKACISEEKDNKRRKHWEQLPKGITCDISKKTRVSYYCYMVEGFLVVFWEPCSSTVNYKKIRKFHKENFNPNIATDAMNFFNVMHAITAEEKECDPINVCPGCDKLRPGEGNRATALCDSCYGKIQ